MGKARKSQTPRQTGTPRRPVRRLKKKSTATVAGGPMVDTALAAESAARMLAARAKLGITGQSEANPERESPTFQRLKQSLSRPASEVASSALDQVLGPGGTVLPPTRPGQARQVSTGSGS